MRTAEPRGAATLSLRERFTRRTDKNGPIPKHRPELGRCWIWIGCKNGSGYGTIKCAKAGITAAHHASWFLHHGCKPTLYVLHACDNRACVNPAHLFLGTPFDNMQDAKRKGRLGWRDSRGIRNGRAKLSEQDVRDIRAAYKCGYIQKEIADKYDVAQTTISNAIRGWESVV